MKPKSLYNKKYREKYPEKRQAKMRSQRMKRTVKGNHLHHWSYNQQHHTDVIEVTPKQHALIHKMTKYMSYNKVFVTLDGRILDTKKKAIEFYKEIGVYDGIKPHKYIQLEIPLVYLNESQISINQ